MNFSCKHQLYIIFYVKPIYIMTTITDILKNNISNDKNTNNMLPFIIINSNDKQLLIKLTNSTNNVICKLNYQYIYSLLKSKNVDPEYFCPLGDIWINRLADNNPINVLLVNTNISIKPIDYIKIDNYYNYSIWKPVGPSGYSSLGFVASIQKPKNNIIRLIPNMFLSEYKNNTAVIEGRNTNMNEYDLLATINEKFYTINKSLFTSKNTNNELKKNDDDCDVWSIKNDNGISLLEDVNPWYDEKKIEHENSTEYFTDIEDLIVEPEPNKPYNKNFFILVCSLLLLISLMVGAKYLYK
jgi:hypothetical protein